MNNDEQALNKVVDTIQKRLRINNNNDVNRLAIKIFSTMKLKDLEKKIEEYPIKYYGKMTPTRLYILNLAKEVYAERKKS